MSTGITTSPTTTMVETPAANTRLQLRRRQIAHEETGGDDNHEIALGPKEEAFWKSPPPTKANNNSKNTNQYTTPSASRSARQNSFKSPTGSTLLSLNTPIGNETLGNLVAKLSPTPIAGRRTANKIPTKIEEITFNTTTGDDGDSCYGEHDGVNKKRKLSESSSGPDKESSVTTTDGVTWKISSGVRTKKLLTGTFKQGDEENQIIDLSNALRANSDTIVISSNQNKDHIPPLHKFLMEASPPPMNPMPIKASAVSPVRFNMNLRNNSPRKTQIDDSSGSLRNKQVVKQSIPSTDSENLFYEKATGYNDVIFATSHGNEASSSMNDEPKSSTSAFKAWRSPVKRTDPEDEDFWTSPRQKARAGIPGMPENTTKPVGLSLDRQENKSAVTSLNALNVSRGSNKINLFRGKTPAAVKLGKGAKTPKPVARLTSRLEAAALQTPAKSGPETFFGEGGYVIPRVDTERRNITAALSDEDSMDVDEETDLSYNTLSSTRSSPFTLPEGQALLKGVFTQVCKYAKSKGIVGEVLNILCVCKALKDACTRVIWEAPEFKSLGTVYKMFKVVSKNTFTTSKQPKRFLFPEPSTENQISHPEADAVSSESEFTQPYPRLTTDYTKFLTSFSFRAINAHDFKHPMTFDIGVFVAETFSNLNTLSVTGAAEWLDDHFLYQFSRVARTKSQMKSIKLCGTNKMSATGLIKCLSRFSNLKELSLDYLAVLNDEVLESIGHGLKNLERLQIRMCLNVSHKGVREILKHTPKMSNVEISNCPNVSDELFTSMVKIANPNITVV